MSKSEVPATDSGYPTPRDDVPSSSRSASPSTSPDEPPTPLTSTPIRAHTNRSKHARFTNFQPDLSVIESNDSESISAANDSNYVLEGVKSFLSASKELKRKERENTALRGENETLRGENESLRDENCSLREESRRFEMDRSAHKETLEEGNVVPKLELDSLNNDRESISDDQLKYSEKIKEELISLITNQDERTLVESKMEKMLITVSHPPGKDCTATAIVKLDVDKMDADMQTESDDHVNVVNANLQIEVDQLNSQIEVLGKKEDDLKHRLFDYEQIKAKFEQDQLKIRSDLEKKLKKSQEMNSKHENKIEELQARLNRRKKDLDEVQAENRRLLEDKSTQGFEIDEMKIHVDLLEKQKTELEVSLESLKGKVRDLEAVIQREESKTLNSEKEVESRNKEYEASVLELKKVTNDALKIQREAEEKLKEIEIENKKILKENQYLTQAQQVFIDSEMNLKSEVSVLTADLRNAETSLTQLKARVEEEKNRRKQLVEEKTHLEIQSKKLLDEKYESDELLAELRKGKLEIDHLRQQVQHLSRDSEEMIQLKKQFEDTSQREKKMKEKLEEALKKQGELEARLEGYIRSEAVVITELDSLKTDSATQKTSLDHALKNAKDKETVIVNLERVYEELLGEFEEFRTSATAQYENDIFVRDQQIENLRVRLLELETYPGQTISVSKRSQEIQTDTVEPETVKSPPVSTNEQDASPEISLISAEEIPGHLTRLEENIKLVIGKMKQVVFEQHINDMSGDLQISPLYLSSETFRKFAEILEVMLSETENEFDAMPETIQRYWAALNEQIEGLTNTLEDRFKASHDEYVRRSHRNEQYLQESIEKLREALDQAQTIADQRGCIATEFREHYDRVEREKEELRIAHEQLVELRNEDNAEFERNEKSLRQRLERAEHDLQNSTRNKLNQTDEYEAELELLTGKLKNKEAEHSREVVQMRKELEVERKKRAYDQETTMNMMTNFNIVKDKAEYLKKRNSDRQRLLNHMMKFAQASKVSRDENETSRQYAELVERVNQSGLLKMNEQETDAVTAQRRVLAESKNTR